MLFVGRKSEKKKIINSLNDGKNIILGGKFGIGRTSLIKEIARIMADERKFVFVDFSQTPGKMSEKIMKEVAISRKHKQGEKMGYKSMRYRIANMKSSKRHLPVIVFDNVAKITVQKKIFLRHLIMEQHFQFIAIVEYFLPEENLFEIKAQLMPTVTLILSHLKKDDVKNLFSMYAKKHNINYSENYIYNLATLSGGYPLGIVEMIKKYRGIAFDE